MQMNLYTRVSHNKKRGFTLVELLVVMVILGILAGILIPISMKFVEDANKAADNANARLLYNATMAYYSKILAADNDVTLDDIGFYIGSSWPPVRSRTYAGIFSCFVTESGQVTVTTGDYTFVLSSGSLIPN